MSVPSPTQQSTISTTITSVPQEHVLPLSLLGASLESVADIVDRSDPPAILFMVRVPRVIHSKDGTYTRYVVEIAEVVHGRVLSTTRPEWVYMHIRELIQEAYKQKWILKRLEF